MSSNDMITYSQAINLAMHQAMELDPSVICYGLGVDDPKRIFGTTDNLIEKFGAERVFDMPTAENGMLGIGIGAAINGLKPVMVHQRMDFFLLAMDQLVNSAAKWNYMFNGQRSVPITIRLVVGRGWGQGPTHAQNLQAWFAHIPGLKVVMPTTPEEARGMLLQSIVDPNPVVFIEHRWLHGQTGIVRDTPTPIPIDKAVMRRSGTDISLVAMSYQVVEALRAASALEQQGISAEVIDLCSIRPIDWPTILQSVEKTGRILALDSGALTGSVSSEVVAKVSETCFSSLKSAPARMGLPDHPEPTSYGLTKDFYYGADKIAIKAHEMVLGECEAERYAGLAGTGHHDVPGDYFKGPF